MTLRKLRDGPCLVLLLVGVSGCSTVLPRAPYERHETVAVTMIWSPGAFSKGRAIIAQTGLHLEFAKRDASTCHAFFPDIAINAVATCSDGTTAKVTLYWTNGNYQGDAEISDGSKAEISTIQT